MRRSSPIVSAFLALTCIAPLAAAAPGPHLSWDRCYADGPVANKTFACDGNAGFETLMLSYETPTLLTPVAGIEIVMQLAATGSVYPAWWEVAGTGRCHAGSVFPSFFGLPGSTCTDPYQGQAAGGVAALQLGVPAAGSARLKLALAVPPGYEWTASPGVEYFAMRLDVSHSRTTGLTTCAGCADKVCLLLGSMRLVGPVGAPDYTMTAGSAGPGGGPASVTWQGAYVANYLVSFDRVVWSYQLGCVTDVSVPTRRSTWASVKGLYR